MAENLIDSVIRNLSGDTLSRLAAAVGGNPQQVQAAAGAGVPAVLAGMLQKGASPQGAGDLLDVLARGNHDSILGNLSGALSGDTSGLARAGAALLPILFGNRSDAVADVIAGQSGLNRPASASLLSLLAPVVMGFVTRSLRGAGGLNPGALASLFSDQRAHVRAAAPAGLASALGLGSLDDLDVGIPRAADAAAVPKAANSWLKWVIGLVIIGALLWALGRCSTNRETAEAPPSSAPAIDSASPAPAAPAASGLIGLMLADGTTIQAAPDGVESRLVAFIQDPSRAVDDDTWFTMDRLEFETDSAMLRPSSAAQLDNIAAILRAYPSVNLKFGGYTDNTGDAAANLQLSTARAGNAMAEVLGRGIDAGRVAAEGYGDQHPVADNATEDGRQRNRRIDVRVTAK